MKTDLITVVQFASGDLWAGAEVQLFNLCQDLAIRDNIRVVVVLLNDGELHQRLVASGIQVVLLDESTLGGFAILLKLTSFLRRTRPEIVHTHRQKENVIGSLACLLAGGIPSLRTVHGAPEFTPGIFQVHKRLFRFLDRFCGRHIQRAIVAVSEDLKGKLSSVFAAETIEVVENGIDTGYVHDEAEKPVTLPAASAVNVCIVARLVPVKRVDLFIAMARKICFENKDITFYVFGDGPSRDKLEELVGECRDKIVFMGFINNILPYLGRMDLLFITSDHEGLPMNLLEALCLKVPVVAHATGGIPKVLDDGALGTLVYEQSPQAYIQAVQDYLSSPEPYTRKAELGYDVITGKYSSRRMGADYAAIYRKILNEAEK